MEVSVPRAVLPFQTIVREAIHGKPIIPTLGDGDLSALISNRHLPTPASLLVASSRSFHTTPSNPFGTASTIADFSAEASIYLEVGRYFKWSTKLRLDGLVQWFLNLHESQPFDEVISQRAIYYLQTAS